MLNVFLVDSSGLARHMFLVDEIDTRSESKQVFSAMAKY